MLKKLGVQVLEKQDYDYDAVIRDIAVGGLDVIDTYQDSKLKKLNDKLNLRADFLNFFKEESLSSSD